MADKGVWSFSEAVACPKVPLCLSERDLWTGNSRCGCGIGLAVEEGFRLLLHLTIIINIIINLA